MLFHTALRTTSLVSLLLMSACAQYATYEPAPVEPETFIHAYLQRDLHHPDLQTFLHEQGYLKAEEWDLRGLTLAGQFYSPELPVAAAEVAEAKAAIDQANVKPDTELEFIAEHHEEHDGISPFTLGSIFTWVYEPQVKRDARQRIAEAQLTIAEIQASLINWHVYDGVLDNYLASFDAAERIHLFDQELDNLRASITGLERGAELGAGADFEISRTRLELQQIQLSKSQEQGRYRQAISGLALAVGIPANDLRDVPLSYREFQELPDLSSETLQLDQLQARALTERPDILRSLADYALAEANLFHAIAEQHPDIRLSPGFIFDQDDNIWTLASAFSLPNHLRHQTQINSAIAARQTAAQRFYALQARVINDVNQAHVQYETALETLHTADQLLADLASHAAKLQRQYDLGYTSEISLLREKQQELAALQSRQSILMQAWQAFASLEDALMTSLLTPH